MAVKRIVANIHAEQPDRAAAFYGDILGLVRVMDFGWIATYEAAGGTRQQVSLMSQGGSDAPVPDLSIEVDDLDDMLARFTEAGVAIEYGPVTESWGVRRFFVRDPFGRLINILSHP